MSLSEGWIDVYVLTDDFPQATLSSVSLYSSGRAN